MSNEIIETYLKILEKELIPSMGCTEPIAIAYCAAVARKTLGEMPEKVLIEVSGNILKNAKSVIVPSTNGKKGIDIAASIGIVAGREDKKLEVISSVTKEDIDKMENFMKSVDIKITHLDSKHTLDIIVNVYKGEHYAKTRIVDEHTNIVLIEKDKKVIFEKNQNKEESKNDINYKMLNVNDIFDFANNIEIDKVKKILDEQIKLNTKISDEGLKNSYGANIGKVLLEKSSDIKTRAKAKAAAASDARMGGCNMPVIICSGSGNQGITASIPVIEYAKELSVDKETLYRALIISNLVTLHIKEKVGRLCAFCGVICAGAGAGAGISYLYNKNKDEVSHTIVNSLAISSGIICDGAKPSCAAKIAMAVESGILGCEMYRNNQQFYDGEGLVSKGVENTIDNFGRLGSAGMRETDKEIIKIMTKE